MTRFQRRAVALLALAFAFGAGTAVPYFLAHKTRLNPLHKALASPETGETPIAMPSPIKTMFPVSLSNFVRTLKVYGLTFSRTADRKGIAVLDILCDESEIVHAVETDPNMAFRYPSQPRQPIPLAETYEATVWIFSGYLWRAYQQEPKLDKLTVSADIMVPDDYGHLQRYSMFSCVIDRALFDRIDWLRFSSANLPKVATAWKLGNWFAENLNLELKHAGLASSSDVEPSPTPSVESPSIELTCRKLRGAEAKRISIDVRSLSLRFTNNTDKYVMSRRWSFGLTNGKLDMQCAVVGFGGNLEKAAAARQAWQTAQILDVYHHPLIELPPGNELDFDRVYCARSAFLSGEIKAFFSLTTYDGSQFSSLAACK
jgi:hypothetical protein